MSQPKRDWEESFDEKFIEFTIYKPGSPAGLKLKSFIRELLLSNNKRLSEKIRGMKVSVRELTLDNAKQPADNRSNRNERYYNKGLEQAALIVEEGV